MRCEYVDMSLILSAIVRNGVDDMDDALFVLAEQQRVARKFSRWQVEMTTGHGRGSGGYLPQDYAMGIMRA